MRNNEEYYDKNPWSLDSMRGSYCRFCPARVSFSG